MILLSVQLAVQCVVSVNKLRPSVREGA